MIIKKYLKNKNFKFMYIFPHSRFSKDYILEGEGFDGIGWKENDKRLYLFQFKSNKKPSKKLLKRYRELEKKYFVKCVWLNKPDRKEVEEYKNEN